MRFNLLASILLSTPLFADSVWLKQTAQIEPFLKSSLFRPTEILLKTGIVGRQGKLTPTAQGINYTGLCRGLSLSSSLSMTAWITHRLSPRETLSEKAGNRLGEEINLLLFGKTGRPPTRGTPCFTGVELDIEPMPKLTAWFRAFAKGVRKTLHPKLRLSAAIPALSKEPIKGLWWPPASAMQLLADIDGVDIMAYDTGSTTPEAYGLVLEESLLFAEAVARTLPGKYARLGLPAYPDKTELHRPEIEKLKAVGGALVKFKGNLRDTMCSPRVTFAFYAGWTMTPAEQQYAKTFRESFQDLCKK